MGRGNGEGVGKATYAKLLRWCGSSSLPSCGNRLHRHLVKSAGLGVDVYGRADGDPFLANLLLQMHGSCGSVVLALSVFDSIPCPDLFSWNLAVAALAQTGRCWDALSFFHRRMAPAGCSPDSVTFLPLISALASLGALPEGKLLHFHILALGLDSDATLTNALLSMYGKCGRLREARTTFERVAEKNSASWNAMISSYAQNGYPQEALRSFLSMLENGFKPNRITFLAVLSACPDSLPNAKAIHAGIIASVDKPDITLYNTLINTYGKCGSVEDASAVFTRMKNCDTISWNAMISAYACNGYGKEAMQLFRQMESGRIKPDKVTFLNLLSVCTNLEIGKAVHESIFASSYPADVAVNNALITMYSKSGSLMDARVVFDEMYPRNLISWNAMIAGYARNGLGKEAIELLRGMGSEGIEPDKATFLSILNSGANLEASDVREIRNAVVLQGLGSDIAIETALLDWHGRCANMEDADALFKERSTWGVISWTAMISAYARNGLNQEALDLFQQMGSLDIEPNRITFLNVLDACANLASLENGRAIHKCIVSGGFESDITINNALLNMYAKCGSLNDAHAFFGEMPTKGLVSWSTMIAAYSRNGHWREALELFRQMGAERIKPDGIAFLSILTACSHFGLEDEGWQFFVSMSNIYAITPSTDHYVCVLDLLGRAGWSIEVEELLRNMPLELDPVIQVSVFGASLRYADEKMLPSNESFPQRLEDMQARNLL